MNQFMEEAIKLSLLQDKGGPFGAVIVFENKIVSVGRNEVIARSDPTAHAEIVAIRRACKGVGHFKLDGCVLYTSCEPCPMCMAACFWTNIDTIYYGCTRKDASDIGFDDEFIYEELKKPIKTRGISMFQLDRIQALKAFQAWENNPNRQMY